MNLYKKTALEIRNLFLSKKLSSKEIVNYFFKRIEKEDSKIKAFILLLKERAEKKAELLDKKLNENKPLGKLAGIPIALKDNIHIKGVNTTCASKILENYKAVFDASCTKFLEEEDAILIGKTNLDEFAMGASTENSSFFTTSNPWDLKCVAGGSSGGSAAAVASRFSPLALGTDTGGSVRHPAAFCGIVGFKPTYGRISRYGIVAFGSSLDQIGPLATSTKDIALIMEVLTKHCKKDSTNLNLPQENFTNNLRKDLKRLKIGVPFKFLKNLKNEPKKNFEKALNQLKELNAEIVEIDLDALKYSVAVYYILAPAEASTNLARFDGIKYGHRSKKATTLDEVYDLSRDEGFGEEVKRRILIGTYVLSHGFHDKYFQKAQKVRTLIIDQFEKAFETCDLISIPTVPFSAFEKNSIKDPIDMYLQDNFTICANLAGLPCITVPSGFDENNKPFGIQLMGPQLHDELVISSAFAYENFSNYSKKIPPLFDKEFF